jgi:hypothetical protein
MSNDQKLSCPGPGCIRHQPVQQEVTDRLVAAGVSGDWVKNARRCSYCGCVYSESVRIIEGWLDSDVLAKAGQKMARGSRGMRVRCCIPRSQLYGEGMSDRTVQPCPDARRMLDRRHRATWFFSFPCSLLHQIEF